MDACGAKVTLWGTRRALGTNGASSLSRGVGPRPFTLGLLDAVPSTPPPSLFRRSFDEDLDRDFRDLNWYWASVIFFSLVTSFILAPSSSEEEEGVVAEASRGVDEDEEDAEACGGGGGAGVRRSWREPSGGAERGSGGRWATVEEVESSTEDVGAVGPDGGGEEEEEETLFSLLSLPSVSVTPARGCR